jgi:hypothetical protein
MEIKEFFTCDIDMLAIKHKQRSKPVMTFASIPEN